MLQPGLDDWFRLAALQHRSVKETQCFVDGWEFVRWQAWFELHPWGPDHDERRALLIARAFRGGSMKEFVHKPDINLPGRPGCPDKPRKSRMAQNLKKR
jgi:hypothetical protein